MATTQEKINAQIEAKKRRDKSRQTEQKIETSTQRKEERNLTGERKAQVEAAGRAGRASAKKLTRKGATTEELETARQQEEFATEFRGQAKAGVGRRTGLKGGELFVGAKGAERTGTAQTGERLGRGKREDAEQTSDLDRAIGEIGSVGKDGPTPEQQRGIAAVEEANKLKQQEIKKQEDLSKVQEGRGLFTQGADAGQAVGVDSTGIPGLPEGTPDVFGQQLAIGGDIAQAGIDTAEANFQAQEAFREKEVRSNLSKLSLGDEGANVLSSLEGTLGKLSLPQLEALAETNGLELTDSLKDSLTRDGKAAIEREMLTKEDRLAENKFSQRQLSRQYDRVITDREEFNVQQDAKNRRLLSAFGGGKSATLGTNVAVMKKAEEGKKAVTDLRETYADKTMLVSRQADEVIRTYDSNVQIINSQMAETIENKYAEITNKLDDLRAAGVTNEIDLNNAILKDKKEYAKLYSDVSIKAFEAIQEQNNTLFDQQLKLRDQQLQEQKERNQGVFGGGGIFGGGQPRSTQTTVTAGMKPLASNSKNAANCILYLREGNPNLPFGLFTKSDKQRAIAQEGFRDPSKVKIGDAMLTAEGDVGHGARVVGFAENGDYILEEANYASGQITTGRTISPDDANIYGFIPANGKIPMNIGGNADLEGTNSAIQTQVDEGVAQQQGEFVPQTPLDQEALIFAKGQQTIQELKNRGATEQEINQIVTRSRELQSQGFAGVSVQDLSPQQQLEAKSLSVDIFGKRAGTKAENVNSIAALKAEGLSNDEIQDRLREAGFGKEFTGTLKNTFTKLTIKGFSQDQTNVNREQLEDLAAEFGQDAPIVKEFVLGLASATSNPTVQTQVDGRVDLISNLTAIEGLLNEYISKGGDTGIFQGKTQKIKERLGEVGDPALANIGNQINIAIQEYRKAISGAAFTESESKEYEGIFPSSGKVPALNIIKMQSLRDVASRNANNFYRRKLGSTNFNELFPNGVSDTLLGNTPQPQAQGGQPQTQQEEQLFSPVDAGISIDQAKAEGKIVVQNAQGQIEFLDSESDILPTDKRL